MIRFIREPKRKKRNEMIHWSNPKYSKWSTLCWTWAPWFYSPHVAHPCCGYYCSHWKLWFFFLFHQSIRFQTYKRHPVCINKNPRTLWKLIQRISSMLPCRWAKIVLQNGWIMGPQSQENLLTWQPVGSKIPAKLLWHCHMLLMSHGAMKSGDHCERMISDSLKMVKQNQGWASVWRRMNAQR